MPEGSIDAKSASEASDDSQLENVNDISDAATFDTVPQMVANPVLDKDAKSPDAPVVTHTSVAPSIPAARRIAQMGGADVVDAPTLPSRRWALLGGATVASAAAALALVLWPGLPAKVVEVEQAQKATTARQNLAVPLREVFSPGLTSPLGKSSNSVSVDTALQLADAYLHGDGVLKNSDEARFWLRHSLRKFSDDPRLAWALTQLGAIYLQAPSGPGDSDRAAALWEIAAARNDPIAHCFLAALHEQGLVNSSSKDSALQLYRDAKRYGGCPNVDQSIQRLSR